MRGGFTLIETLLYVVLFSIIIVAIMNVGLFLSTSSGQTSERSLLISEGSLVMNKIIKTVETGATYNSGSSSIGSSPSTLVFTDNDADTISLRMNTDKIEKGLNGVFSDLHSTDLIVDSFVVERLNTNISEEIFRISIDFSNVYGDTFSITSSANFLYD